MQGARRERSRRRGGHLRRRRGHPVVQLLSRKNRCWRCPCAFRLVDHRYGFAQNVPYKHAMKCSDCQSVATQRFPSQTKHLPLELMLQHHRRPSTRIQIVHTNCVILEGHCELRQVRMPTEGSNGEIGINRDAGLNVALRTPKTLEKGFASHTQN